MLPLRRGARLFQRLVWLSPALLLTACGPVPFLGPESGPPGSPTVLTPPTPIKPGTPDGQAKTKAQTQPPPQPQTPSLAPLATQQQVVKAVTVGRRDPFAAVLTPNVLPTPVLAPQAGGQAVGQTKTTKPKAPSPPTWPQGLLLEGVLQTFSATEAMVRYSPGNAKGGGTRVGTLQVGDVGTTAPDSLLPPGWQVAAIDGEQGVLVLRKGNQSVSQRL